MAERLGTQRTTDDSRRKAANEQARGEWREYLQNFTTDGKLEAPKLSALREQMGFSRVELGNLLGLPEATIQSAEEGKDVGFATPSLTRFVNAAKAVTEGGRD